MSTPKGRAVWLNVFERPDGSRHQSRFSHGTRQFAHRAAVARMSRENWKLLYRIRVRFYLEPKT